MLLSLSGRFAVAAEDIPLGTTLIKESPITYALHPVNSHHKVNVFTSTVKPVYNNHLRCSQLVVGQR
jgi:hypothetical protein